MELATLIPQTSALFSEGASVDIRGLTADSRAVKPGYLFAALPGYEIDGARFIGEALARGAAAVLTHADWQSAAPPLADEFEDRPVFETPNPRRELALAAARFYGRQPSMVCAVTGTNGKTSVASFTRQIWTALGRRAASLGTLGLQAPEVYSPTGHTTPDPVWLQRTLHGLALANVQHVAMEASSHGIEQNRLDGVEVKAAAFTNLTHDHLDYHKTLEDYLFSKMRLFGEILRPGGVAVLNADAAFFRDCADMCWGRGIGVFPVGRAAGATLRIIDQDLTSLGQTVLVAHDGQTFDIHLPLVGAFQAMNALMAAGLVMASGGEARAVFDAMEHLVGAPGRMQRVGETARGAAVIVDYAHTPDALETVLRALRPHTEHRLHVIFGCGGDRDAAKRPRMGAIAMAEADVAILTDDNPRTEDAASIRREVRGGMKDGTAEVYEIGDRREAIRFAIAGLEKGDILIVAGKGHERGQIVGEKVLPFSDIEETRAALSDVAARKEKDEA